MKTNALPTELTCLMLQLIMFSEMILYIIRYHLPCLNRILGYQAAFVFLPSEVKSSLFLHNSQNSTPIRLNTKLTWCIKFWGENIQIMEKIKLEGWEGGMGDMWNINILLFKDWWLQKQKQNITIIQLFFFKGWFYTFRKNKRDQNHNYLN